jgi:competence protein ComEC
MRPDSLTSGHSAAGFGAVPLFCAACLFAAGIVCSRLLWLRPSLVLLALAFAAALACLAAQRALRIAWVPLAVLWFLLGNWCALMQPQPAPAPALATLSDDLLRTVEGTVINTGPVRSESEMNVDEPADEPELAAPTQRLAPEAPVQRIDLRVSSVEEITDTVDAQIPLTGGVRLTVRWPATSTLLAWPTPSPPLPFRCGERVRAEVRLLPPETYHDPGVWSRADYLLDQGITSTATVSIDRIEQLGPAPGVYLACRVANWQHASTTRLLALPARMHNLPAPLRLSPEDAAMIAAMIAGDRTYLNEHLRVGFERTGSFHMLVVSGFHLAVVAGGIFWLARRVRLPRLPATLLTLLASFAYALFTGFATPVQRSLGMVTLYLLSRLLYRERNPINTIGFAALCLLAVNPRSLFDSSLQMTLLAVIAIAGIAAPLLQSTIHPYLAATRDLRLIVLDPKLAPALAQFRVTLRMFAQRLAKALNPFLAWRVFPFSIRFLLRLIELLVVSSVIELVMTLPMAVYFHRITLYALPVNLVILPLLFVLIPAALLTLCALATWPAAAVIPAALTAITFHLGFGLVRLFGSFTLGDLRIPAPLLWQAVLSCALLAAAIVLAHLGLKRRWPRSAAWAALLASALAAVAPRPIDHPRGGLLVEAIDVGQGDSLLLITPDGKTLLVDGGGFGGGPRQAPHPADEDLSAGTPAPQDFDIGEEIVSPALWARGIRHLDAVALTHAHSDHMGGLPAILRNFHPDELWVGNNPPIPAYEALLAEASALHVRLRTLRAADDFSFGRAEVHVLAPFRDYQPGVDASNNDSLVLHVAFGATSVLLEGDAEAPIEDAMLSESGLASTLLKVGHHGSITSTRPEFLARVAPQWAVISCGLHNRYGHPRQEVLEELQAARVRTFRTDINGIACFVLDGKSAQAQPACGPD